MIYDLSIIYNIHHQTSPPKKHTFFTNVYVTNIAYLLDTLEEAGMNQMPFMLYLLFYLLFLTML